MDFFVLVLVLVFVFPRVLFFDKARGALWLAAAACAGERKGGRGRRAWVPVGGLICAAICALAAGAPVGLVAWRVVLAEAWAHLGAALLALGPLPCRKASLELLGLWGALSVWGLPLGPGAAAAGVIVAAALPAAYVAGLRVLDALLLGRRPVAGRAAGSLNSVSSAIQAAAWVGAVGAACIVLAGTLGVGAALHGAFAASAALRRPRRRRLPRGDYYRRVRGPRAKPPAGGGVGRDLRLALWRFVSANKDKKKNFLSPSVGGRAGLEGSVAWVHPRGRNSQEYPPPPEGGRAGSQESVAGIDPRREENANYPPPHSGGRAGPEGFVAWADTRGRNGQEYPPPSEGGRAGPEGAVAGVGPRRKDGRMDPARATDGAGASVSRRPEKRASEGGIASDRELLFSAEQETAGTGRNVAVERRGADRVSDFCSGVLRLVRFLLLMRAGDVESNPGPRWGACTSGDSRTYVARAAERGLADVAVVDSGIQSAATTYSCMYLSALVSLAHLEAAGGIVPGPYSLGCRSWEEVMVTAKSHVDNRADRLGQVAEKLRQRCVDLLQEHISAVRSFFSLRADGRGPDSQVADLRGDVVDVYAEAVCLYAIAKELNVRVVAVAKTGGYTAFSEMEATPLGLQYLPESAPDRL